MKKFLCLVVTLLLVFSCFFCLSQFASATTEAYTSLYSDLNLFGNCDNYMQYFSTYSDGGDIMVYYRTNIVENYIQCTAKYSSALYHVSMKLPKTASDYFFIQVTYYAQNVTFGRVGGATIDATNYTSSSTINFSITDMNNSPISNDTLNENMNLYFQKALKAWNSLIKSKGYTHTDLGDFGFLSYFSQLNSISVKTSPQKLSYSIGDTFDSSGLTLTARYSDGTSMDISSGFECSGFSSSTAGLKEITVTYSGKSTVFYVYINTPSPTANTVLKSFVGNKTINYKEKVHITANAEKLPLGFYVAIYEGVSQKANVEADANGNATVEWTSDNLTENKTYTVKIVDTNGNVQDDNTDNELSREINVSVNSSFFNKLIALFKGLFGSLSTIEIKP